MPRLLPALSLAAAVLTAAPGPVIAGAPEDAAYISGLIDMEAMVDVMLSQLGPLMAQSLKAPLPGTDFTLSPRARDAFLEIYLGEMRATAKVLFTDLNRQVMLETFSAKELADLAAFARTPTGAAFYARQPQMMRRGAELGNQLGRQAAGRAFDMVVKRLRGSGDPLLLDPEVQEELRRWSKDI